MNYPSITFEPTNAAQQQAALKLCHDWQSLQAPTAPTQVSLEDLRANLTELSRNGKNAEVKQLLLRHGAKTLNQLAPEHYATVMVEAGALC
jgi:hypothetical protein